MIYNVINVSVIIKANCNVPSYNNIVFSIYEM